MNRKRLLLLLLLPLLVLATDKVLGSIGPRNAPEKGIEMATIFKTDGGAELDEKSAQKVKRYMQILHKQGMDIENAVWAYEVEEETQTFLNNRLMPVVNKVLSDSDDLDMLFSRCPSGYFYVLEKDKDDQLTNIGWLGENEGCSEVGVGSFAYDVEAKTVKMILPHNLGYMPVKQYLELFDLATS